MTGRSNWSTPTAGSIGSGTRSPRSSCGPEAGTWWSATFPSTGRPYREACSTSVSTSFHNGRRLLDRGTGPYFYLPKLEGHREVQLGNDVFQWSEATLGLPRGAIKATVLVESILAAFDMDEILH